MTTSKVINQDSGSREKLIEATIRLMGSHGFEPMGISLILEEAGVTKSNFYYHFKSKEELCLTALDQMADTFFEQMVEPILSDNSIKPDRRLEKFLKNLNSKMQENCCQKGCPFVNLAAETSEFHPSFREKIEDFYRRYADAIAACVGEGQKEGVFRRDIKAGDAANLVLSAINGSIVLAKVRRDPVVIEANIKATLSMLKSHQ
ncbi:MAG: TetR/AcrR family transcriptional regulator [Cyanobacteria bacterium HKST-UBA02]|nr:TetR/AcrR family transcriptional regulator [Cyanobacteria bacterium HKST-UBA02]